jgi:heme/copper-type cytochrome/quinol oxidase subunit 2
MAGAISLPSEEGTLGEARSWFNKKWNGNHDETTPLLQSERPRRITTFRIVVTIVALVIALVLLAVSIFFWFHHHEKKDDKRGKHYKACVLNIITDST